ncbi:MAG: Histidine triad (HIT) nucleotide-binding protein, similarity with At5g48545 and yeast YDL125C (HNT1), partial [uncultured Solirubrobacteraceae bacterium]
GKRSDLPVLSHRRRGAARRARARGRSDARVHGHRPGHPRASPGRAARARRRRPRDRSGRPGGVRGRREDARDPPAGASRSGRDQPAVLVGRGGLADGGALPHARHPALRGGPAAAAVGAATRSARGDRRGRRAARRL